MKPTSWISRQAMPTGASTSHCFMASGKMASMFRFFGAAAAVFLALSLSCGAQARPRDDVMAAAATCGTETGGRAWLDCYYKATAPMRTALGLAPLSSAPARKPAAMTAAELSARDQVLSAAYGCTTVAEDRGW